MDAQQIIAYKDQKIGIGLNGDKFFSPEFQIKIERHSFLVDYYLFEPSLGCKVRYYMADRGYIYSGAFASWMAPLLNRSGQNVKKKFVSNVLICPPSTSESARKTIFEYRILSASAGSPMVNPIDAIMSENSWLFRTSFMDAWVTFIGFPFRAIPPW